MSTKQNKRHFGWKILGYALVVLTVLLSLGAIVNLTTGLSSGDASESMGKVIASIFFPVVVGYSARNCLRRSRK